YFGTNLANIPTAPFTNSWWYRTEFDASDKNAVKNAELIFEGINYHANIWLNGERLAGADQTFGAYRIFKLDATGHLKSGKNVLAVEIFPPKPGDFTMGFVDWNPKPPDRNMGLFRPVKVHFYKSVAVENVFVTSKIDHDTWQQAELTVSADLINRSTNIAETTVHGLIGAVTFSEKFTLQAGETRTVKFTPADHPELKFAQPKLWWPWELGAPNLYTLKLTAKIDGDIADVQSTRFGIREVADYISPDSYRGYMVNGKKILIRGGGWADELLLRESHDNLAAQIGYTKAMNLNTIRLEGVWGSSQQLYDLADENGLLVMVGWSCQWEWTENLGKKTDEKYGGFLTEEDMKLATNYLHDQVFWLRNHPSIYVWVLGSDMLPHPELEKRYDKLLPLLDPTRPALKSCGTVVSKVSGPSAVKMNGPYDYVTPDYWYLDTKNGGAFGFNTETGPGPQPPTLETMQRMFPADHLWPIDDVWNFHCGRGEFGQINRYLNAFNHRYGASTNAAEFAYKSQAANYEAMRAMYEAFAVNLPHTTGIVQWMLNASWPKLYWQLYDYYLVPSGAFFGTKHGAAPFAVIYNYGDQGIYLVNQTGRNFGSQRTTITAYDLNSKIILNETVTNDGMAYGSQKIRDLSKFASGTSVYFLDLKTTGETGLEATANNFYWLSTKPDVLDEDKTKWFVTPNKSFADFTALNQLPPATVRATASFAKKSGGMAATITLANESDSLAFFIEMKITGATSQQLLTPILWDDNYVSLPPHTKKTFHAQFPAGEEPGLKLQGWNVKFVKAN
ncbi:MAG TPA: glycoside hydrolase family 2 TIM barrel-domain containing protein, partial [Verrucomicrobiae bacterium]|nr:glycoside hydrolase family 2 TIM barrel-domain containing protein [Verrucomicrobiae bacterium]